MKSSSELPVIEYCDRCGEPFRHDEARAEVFDPNRRFILPNGETSLVVHAEPCGAELFKKGWEVA